MGCMTSAPKEPESDRKLSTEKSDSGPATSQGEDANNAKKQRRRLSVAPNQVGDISPIVGEFKQKAEAEETNKSNNPDDEGLTPLELKGKGKVRHALKTRKGVVPYNTKKVNQDRPVIKYALGDDPGITLWGVMDGHGEFGHLVASFVQDKLPYHLGLQKDFLRQDPDKYITLAVKNMCDELAESDINVAFSGTTCVFGVLIDGVMYVANIGDSRCVVCRQNDNGVIQSIGLSYDQKPDNPKEKERILKAGGRVEPLPGPPGEDNGPSRVWLAEVDVPGLAMSRSIGDEVSQTVGVISVPEIISHPLQSNDVFAVWASDGVWEFLTNEQAIDIVWKHRNDLQAAANALAEEANRLWRREEEVVDDITCVIVQFNEIREITEEKNK